jgi:PH domain
MTDTKSSSQNEPEMKGWLFKWTNYLKGYQRRWFVLQNGTLSYYRSVLQNFRPAFSLKLRGPTDVAPVAGFGQPCPKPAPWSNFGRSTLVNSLP